MSKMKLITIICVIGIFLSGCVSKDEYEQLELTLADVRAQLNQKNKKIRELEQKAQSSNDIQSNYLKNIEKLKSSVGDLKKQKEQLSLNMSSLNSKLETARSELQQKERALEQLQKEKTKLKNTLEAQLKSSDSRITELMKMVQSQGQALTELSDAKELSEKQLESIIIVLDQKNKELDEAVQKNQILQSSQVLLRQELQTHVNQKSTLIAELEQQIKILTTEKETSEEQFKDTITKLRTILTDQESRLLEAKTNNDELRAKEHNLVQKLEAAEDAIRKFDTVKSKAEKKVNALENELRERDERFNAANADLQHLIESEKQLEKQVQQAQSMLQKLKVEKTEGWSRLQELQTNFKKRGQTLTQLNARLSQTEREKSEVEGTVRRLQKTYEDLVDQFETEINEQEATIRELKEKLSVTLIQDILFKSGDASITRDGKQILKKIGNILKQNQSDKIVVAGHSDSMPIAKEYRTRYASNWELSAARAAAVVRYFQYEIGIDPPRMEAVGHSFYKPIASNNTPDDRSKNRRVEIFIMPTR